ncbi:MAG: winged helix-turn-helix domain-containing protein [Stagnimonas sp.]|nr:winged helix-turn-helix domain-containing protein [Stagnimonas sp.]
MDDSKKMSSAGREDVGGLWMFADAELNERTLRVQIKGTPVELDYKAVEVLLVLLRHAGEVVTKDELFDTVWAGRETVDGVLTNAISKLRKVLGDAVIATQHRIGYRLTVPVKRRSLDEGISELHLKPGDAVPAREAWLLLRPLGSGGEGEVWLAEQAKNREQRVFKFAIDAGRLSALKREVTLYRLLREVLGERRDFARVLEWNFTAPPFFIECEYGGLSLSDWAKQGAGLAAASLENRVRLLAETADAVAAAHSAGVLHKDLKPGNVLIWRDEAGLEHARLTDFGSSRLADPSRLDAAGITRLGFTVTQMAGEGTSGTPLYLAPELLLGQLPTAQSDVYSLGVMLYQLVVGDLKRPLSSGWEQDVSDPLLRADIAAAAHGKPSERIASADELARRLRTLEARRVEAQRQYQLAARATQAEAALQRDRARRPIFVALFGILLVGLLASLFFRQQAVQAGSDAARQFEIAKATNGFLKNSLLSAANPLVGGRADISLREAVDRAAPLIEQSFAGQPETEAALRQTLGDAYYQLTAFQQAEVQLQAAVVRYRSLPGQKIALIESELSLVEVLARQSKFDEARTLLNAADANLVGVGEVRLALLRARAEANLLAQQLQYDKAIPVLETAIAQAETTGTAAAETLLGVRQALASAYARSKQTAKAEQTLVLIVEAQRKARGWKHPATLAVRHSLARLRLAQGQERESLAAYRELIADMSEALGPQSENTLLAQHGLSLILTKLEQWAEAERTAAAVHRGLVTAHGSEYLQSLNALNQRNVALLRLGRASEANASLRTALAYASPKFGEDNLLVVIMRSNLAHGLVDEGRYAEADSTIRQVKAAAKGKLDDSDWVGEMAYLEGRIAQAQGDVKTAADRYQWAEQSLSLKNPPEYWLRKKVARQNASLPTRASQPKA